LPPFLSIIIPAHNEELRLPDSLARILGFVGRQAFSCEILVVENGSQDNTAAVVEDLMREHANLSLLREALPGKGRAVRQGMLAARGEYRFICDADLSMPIDEIVKFIPPALQGADIAIASREAPGAVRYNEPAYRHWIGRAFNQLVRWLALPGLQDTQCGFKCFRSPAAVDLFSLQVIDGWTFDVEVLFIGQHRGYQIVEVPIHWHHHPGSRVRLVSDSVRMFLDLFRIRRNWRRGLYARQAQPANQAEFGA
jgi:dolichyl-phosphate beta-glucosyltransferase